MHVILVIAIPLLVAIIYQGWRSTRKRQLFVRRLFWFELAVWFAISCYALLNGAYWLLILITIPFLDSARSTFRKSNEKDLLQNFVDDPRHCGQCEYDLTGNVSGTCPECGWNIPDENTMIEDDNWTKWWIKWEIGYLEHPQKQLHFHALLGLVSIAIGPWILLSDPHHPYFGYTLFLVALFALLFLNCAINTIRIWAYIKKQRDSSPD
ncbi:MAG: hypothetical protein GXY44_14075 [Phycisphaerales bacterium]|nr:hypothetical protein [Phycisphaerales bacterium]